MKINNVIKGITLITVSFLCACSDDYNLPTGEGMKVLISIDEFQSDEKTRTTTDPNNNYAITWASGDTLGIFPREGFTFVSTVNFLGCAGTADSVSCMAAQLSVHISYSI